ncbi:hypothetical protein [Amycolatopsis sp. A1MSW2902]|uniref:hypothetical protein n=1 Tax=Amycolatopsis sp. A1MSW2902 TaxID=687413 RepID=UPI00307CFD2A
MTSQTSITRRFGHRSTQAPAGKPTASQGIQAAAVSEATSNVEACSTSKATNGTDALATALPTVLTVCPVHKRRNAAPLTAAL